jgi:cytochrome c oxidase subunit 2
MKNKGVIIWAAVMLAVGAAGLVGAFLLFGGPTLGGSFSSPGQRIYYTGADANGPIPRTIAGGGMMGIGGMGTVSCVSCHGEDGRGGRVGTMFGAIDIPDIRYATLTTAHSEGTATIPAWTDADIGTAIRDGVEPNGQPLKAPMPRWSMTDTDMSDVIAYLKELSQR